MAGNELSKQDYNQAIGKFCIIQITDGEIVVRELRPGLKHNYSLRITNPDPDILQPILYDTPFFVLRPLFGIDRKAILLYYENLN